MSAVSTHEVVTEAGPLDTPEVAGPAIARRPEDLRAEGVVRALRDDGTLDPEVDPCLTKAEVMALYRHMVLMRQVDARLTALQRQGRIGFHVGSTGEEATILGSVFAMRPQDWVFPCYREFGAALWRGMPLQRYVDNSYGNATDPAKGRQMPDHYFWKPGHVTSISSPIGTQITQAVGFAWAAKMRRDDVAAIVYFGEGATSSSEFHNGMNFAGVFKAPVVMLCRNNGWAISVPTERQTASDSFAQKGLGYGIPGVRVDGNDLFAVIRVTRDALERAVRGEGPTLIEALTYRMLGHSTSDDPKAYRPDVTLEPWRAQDPIARLRAYVAREYGWSSADEAALEGEVEAQFKAVVAVAEKTPPPALETMFDDVYGEVPWHLREQREELLKGPRARGH